MQNNNYVRPIVREGRQRLALCSSGSGYGNTHAFDFPFCTRLPTRPSANVILMKEKHVVLRTLGGATRDSFRGPSATTLETVAAGLSVEVEEIDRNKIPALTRNLDVLAVAPVVPMKLIEPVEVPVAAVAESATIAWGVKAVGADSSPFDGAGVIAAVLDTGIDAGHPAFSGVDAYRERLYRRG